MAAAADGAGGLTLPRLATGAALAVALALPLLVRDFVAFQLTLVMVYAIAILGLNLLTGFNGQFSLGHSAFFAIGAYTAAILMERLGVPYLWTLPAAGAACFVFGFLFGLPALRLEGIYLALATFALAIAMPQILKFSALKGLTGGVQGVFLVKPRPPAWFPLGADQWYYYLTLAVLLAMFAAAANLVASRTGRAIMAIRDHPIAARAMGINAALYKSLTFGVSALYTGVAGALAAITIEFVAPDSFTFLLSVALLVGMVVGGVGSIPGALVGGVFVLFVPNLAEQVSKGLAGAVYGIMLLLLIYLMPSGAAGFARLVGRRLVARRNADSNGPSGEDAMKRRTLVLAAALAPAASLPAAAQKKYDPGASDAEIKIGNIMPYSGPASAYGTIGKAQAAFFKMINERGGINGRRVNFISYDDGYSPPKAFEQARKLVESDEVLLLFQALGTPSNSAIHRYMNQKKVPQLFVATGATKWGDPKNFPWTMGWQPNYQSEGRIYAKYLIDKHAGGKVAVLYQNDDYGQDLLQGLKDGLGARAKTMIVAEAPFEVTDPTVDSQIVTLKASGADVFVNVATPKFAAQAIRKMAEIGWTPAANILNNVSNSVGGVLKVAGPENAKGALSTFYFKDSTDPTWKDDPAMKEWVEFMDRYYPEGDKSTSFNVYAYAVSQTLAQVLRQCGDDLTRDNVMRQAAGLKNFSVPILLPGIVVNTGPNDFFPIEQMQLARFNGERWELFGQVINGAIGSGS